MSVCVCVCVCDSPFGRVGPQFSDELVKRLALSHELVQRSEVLLITGILLMTSTPQMLRERERERERVCV